MDDHYLLLCRRNSHRVTHLIPSPSHSFLDRYTGWLCRGMVSATTYTLVGVVNKFLTVLLNVVIWDKHSSPLGIVAVCICLTAGMFYQQAPMRQDKTSDADSDGIPLLKSSRK
jgi:hypothetical protein